MLPPFIIEQLRQREEQRRRQEEHQPQLHLPLPLVRPTEMPPPEEESPAGRRGVVILDL